MSKLGSSKSKRKQESSRRNVKKAQQAKLSPEKLLMEAYQMYKKGGVSKSWLAINIAKCRHSRLVQFFEDQEGDVGI